MKEKQRTKIGSGFTGTVYREWSDTYERYVAVKVVKEDPLVEVTNMITLMPFDVSQLLEFSQNEEEEYEIVMEYLTGTTMQQLIEERTMDWMERLLILRNLCCSIESIKMYFEHLVFSDLKPSNIMVDSKGNTTIIDLEDILPVGKIEGDWKASPYYSAPEISRAMAHKKSDIYNLGRTFEQMDWEVHLIFRMFLVRGCIRRNPLLRLSLSTLIHRLEFYMVGYRSLGRIHRFLRRLGGHLIEITVCICILVLGYDIIKFTLG